jgi:curved DNA-binding protein CbpA
MTNDRPDYYAVLRVAHTASPDEIKRAYHRLVRLYHPDTHPPDTDPPETPPPDSPAEDLRELIAAYAVLRDPARRADYDRRRTALRPRPARPAQTGTQPLIRVGPVRYHGPGSTGTR